mmetsp:Transcript_11976/g.18376  ORF Transcript_11976/g.18376 Transcript_11976/m.18376 type:complete len:133 (-) Transcript_11976:244-642(-)
MRKRFLNISRHGRRWKSLKSFSIDSQDSDSRFRTISTTNSFQSRLMKFRNKRKMHSWDEQSAESFKIGPLETPIGDIQRAKFDSGKLGIDSITIVEQSGYEHTKLEVIEEQNSFQRNRFGFENNFFCGCYDI